MSNSPVLKLGITAFIGFFLASIYLILYPLIFYKPVIALALPAVFALMLILVVKPQVVLVFLILSRAILNPFLETTRLNFLGQDMSIGAALNLAVIVLFVIFLNMSSKDQFSFLKQNRGWFLFLLFTGIAIFYSPDPGRALRIFLNFVSYFCMAMLPLLVIKDHADKRFWQKIMLISIVLTTVIGDIDLARGGHFYGDAGQRIAGTFTHPNILAFYSVWGIVFCLYLLMDGFHLRSKFLRNSLLALTLNLFVLLLMTKTRNAWIACWIMFFLFGLFGDKRILVITLLLPPLALLVPSVNARVMDLFVSNQFREYQGENSWSWRVSVWQSAFPWILRNPIFGYGLTSFVPLSMKFFNSAVGVGAHNVYVELLFETGLVGVLSYITIFGGILRRLWQTIRGTVGLMSKKYLLVFVYVISYLIINFADNLLYYLPFNWYFWFFIGMVMVSSKLNYENDIRHHPVV